MTVKKIPQQHHALYAWDYVLGLETITTLAQKLGVHRKTISRMLAEQEVYTPRPYRRKPKPVSPDLVPAHLTMPEVVANMHPFPDYVVDPQIDFFTPARIQQLFSTPMSCPQPKQKTWFQRAKGFIKHVFHQVVA